MGEAAPPTYIGDSLMGGLLEHGRIRENRRISDQPASRLRYLLKPAIRDEDARNWRINDSTARPSPRHGLPNRIEVRDDALARLEDGLKLNLNEPTTKIRGHCTGAEGTRP